MKCFHCGLFIDNWQLHVDPWFEHAKPDPVCKFILQIKGKLFFDKVKPIIKDRFTTEESRIRSFENWPASANKTPEELAKAGFFYTGTAHLYF